jgi:uncharacterized membrane protein
MERVEKEVEVDAPVTVVYNQFTQFEEFPEFMEGVTNVRQLDDRRLYWSAEIFGQEFDWDSELYEQVPDTSLRWRSTSGKKNEGGVYFTPNGDKSRVRLVFEYEPADYGDKTAEVKAFFETWVAGNLQRFRDFIERRGRETGGWAGIAQGTKSH